MDDYQDDYQRERDGCENCGGSHAGLCPMPDKSETGNKKPKIPGVYIWHRIRSVVKINKKKEVWNVLGTKEYIGKLADLSNEGWGDKLNVDCLTKGSYGGDFWKSDDADVNP